MGRARMRAPIKWAEKWEELFPTSGRAGNGGYLPFSPVFGPEPAP